MKKIKVQQVHQGREPQSEYQVTVSTGSVWAVCYRGQPIQVRKEHVLTGSRKYLPTSSTQAGTAKRLARKLNQLFNCTDYQAVQIDIENNP